MHKSGSFFYTYFILPFVIFGKTFRALNLYYKTAKQLPFESSSEAQIAALFKNEVLPWINKAYLKDIPNLITKKTSQHAQDLINEFIRKKLKSQINTASTQSLLSTSIDNILLAAAKENDDLSLKSTIQLTLSNHIKEILKTNPPQSFFDIAAAALNQEIKNIKTEKIAAIAIQEIERNISLELIQKLINEKEARIAEQYSIIVDSIVSNIANNRKVSSNITESIEEEINKLLIKQIQKEDNQQLLQKAESLFETTLKSIEPDKLSPKISAITNNRKVSTNLTEAIEEEINKLLIKQIQKEDNQQLLQKAQSLFETTLKSIENDKISPKVKDQIIQQINKECETLLSYKTDFAMQTAKNLITQHIASLSLETMNPLLKQKTLSIIQQQLSQTFPANAQLLDQEISKNFLTHIVTSSDIQTLISPVLLQSIQTTICDLIQPKIKESPLVEKYSEELFQSMLEQFTVSKLDPILELQLKTIFHKKLKERLQFFENGDISMQIKDILQQKDSVS